MGASILVHVFARFDRTFRLYIDIHVRRIAHGRELVPKNIYYGIAIVDHSVDVDPVAAVIKQGLGGGTVIVQRHVEKTYRWIGRTDTANTEVRYFYIVLDINGVSSKIVRQGQDPVRVIGRTGRIIGAGGGQRAGGYAQLIQIDGAGGFNIELVRRGFSERASTSQVPVDEIIDIAA